LRRGPAFNTARVKIARTLFRVWLLAIIVVCCLSLLPPNGLRPLQAAAFNDKLGHFMAYLILAVLPVVGMDLVGMGIALAFGMIPLGVVLEFSQRLVPGRSFETGDIVANSIGVLIGVGVALCLRPAVRGRAATATQDL
jgi:VanZ family protein